MTREMDLAIAPQTGNRRDRATIRELLQMRACDKINDTDTRAVSEERVLLRNSGSKNKVVVSPELLTSVVKRKHRT